MLSWGPPPPGERSPLSGGSLGPLSETTLLAAQVLEMLGNITKIPPSCTERPGGDVVWVCWPGVPARCGGLSHPQTWPDLPPSALPGLGSLPQSSSCRE